MSVTLGLDVGTNSIGWALVDQDTQQIIDLGVRHFPEGVDNFDTSKEKSRNETRRIARGMRRQTARRSYRKHKLREALIAAGLYPANPAEQDKLEQQDPYALRARAIHDQLEPHQVGRALLHLNQRRGFLSNRKKDRGDSEVRGMLEEISELAKDKGDQTLGQYLHNKTQQFDHTRRVENDHVRKRHTRRLMLEDEFDAIWNAQARHHPDLLTEQLRWGTYGSQSYPCKPHRKSPHQTDVETFGVQGLIFFQRRMYWPASVIGLCELEPKQKRCPRADRHAQYFRLLQEINNLRYIDPDTQTERALTAEQRTLLLGHLATREKATFDQLRSKLGFLESVKFNLERGQRPSIKGMVVDWMMGKAVGKQWHDRPEHDKDSIIRMLLGNEREDEAIADLLVSDFEFTSEQAQTALDVDFPPGYIHLSLKAIDRLLPHMERGLVYQSVSDPQQSALHAAGYLRRDELQRRIFDKLPDPARTRESPIGDIPNPVVKRALVELRKVVNAIIRDYGMPDAVHVEMTREVRQGPKMRREYNKRMRDREKQRDQAADALRQRNIRVSRQAIDQYLFWEQQQHECIYCQRTISQKQLFGGDVDVDHILPYSRCLDDSQANKVVCHRQCNHDKGQRTPHEWLADADPNRYERICQHAGALLHKGLMPYGKYRKFLQQELDLDQFIARQLTDTGYIARATGEYLRCLFEHDHDVLGLKGQHTAELRRQWGLNTVLQHDDPSRKNRDDHRHHAVDAVIIALTNRSQLQKLARMRKNAYVDRQTGEVLELPAPWDGFRNHVAEKIDRINVSHRVERKVAGALHEDTLYGPTPQDGVYVVRKSLENLSFTEVREIRDPSIRQIIERRLAQHGIEVEGGKKPDARQLKQALCNADDPLTMPSGVPIKKVRVLRKDKTIQTIRTGRAGQAMIKPGATHHLCIFEWDENGKTKRDAVFVTMLEAINRVKNKQTIIERTHPTKPDARFVMSLSRGEMVLAKLRDGSEALLTYSTAASTTQQIWFFGHTDARQASAKKKLTFSPSTLTARKVTVDPLGRIRWAND